MNNPLNPLAGPSNGGVNRLVASLPSLPGVQSGVSAYAGAGTLPPLSAKEKEDQEDVRVMASEGGVAKLLQRLNARAESVQENPLATASPEAGAQLLLSRLSAAGSDVTKVLAALGSADGPNLVEMWKALNQIYDQCKQGVTAVDTARLSKASQFTPEVVSYANGKVVPSLLLSDASAKRLGQFIAAELKAKPATSFDAVLATAAVALSDDPSIQKALADRKSVV